MSTGCLCKNSVSFDGALRRPEDARGTGIVLDVQCDLLDELRTRVVVPLVPLVDRLKVVRKLNPTFVINGQPHAMMTHLVATVPVAFLGAPVTNLAAYHDEIVVALDMLFQGF